MGILSKCFVPCEECFGVHMGGCVKDFKKGNFGKFTEGDVITMLEEVPEMFLGCMEELYRRFPHIRVRMNERGLRCDTVKNVLQFEIAGN